MDENILETFMITRSDDLAKQDRELTCGSCGKPICDVEEGDTLSVLGQTAQDHYNICSGN